MMNRARVAGLVDEETGREVYVHPREQAASRAGHGTHRWPGVIRSVDRPLITESRRSVSALLASELPDRIFRGLLTSVGKSLQRLINVLNFRGVTAAGKNESRECPI